MSHLIITSANGSLIVVPENNKNFIERHNQGASENERYKIGQSFPTEAEALEFVKSKGGRDNQYSPNPKVGMLQNIVQDQRSEIEKLKEMLARAQGGNVPPLYSGPPQNDTTAGQVEMKTTGTALNVVDTLKLIKTLDLEGLNKLIAHEKSGQNRTTIIANAELQITKLSK